MAQATTADRTRTRGNGDGSIYERGDKFRVVVSVPDPLTGVSTRRSFTAKTRREAEKLLAKKLEDRHGGMTLSSVTVETFMASWLATQKASVKASTFRGRELHIRSYINPTIGRIQ